MSGLVIDASAAIDLLREEGDIGSLESELFAPEIIDLEFLQSLRRLVRVGRLPAEAAYRRIELWTNNELTRCPHLILIPRVWALSENITAYDAAYVALAEALGVPLVTADIRLARAAKSFCEVIALES